MAVPGRHVIPLSPHLPSGPLGSQVSQVRAWRFLPPAVFVAPSLTSRMTARMLS